MLLIVMVGTQCQDSRLELQNTIIMFAVYWEDREFLRQHMFFTAVCSSEIAQDRASPKQLELNSVASAALSMVEATS